MIKNLLKIISVAILLTSCLHDPESTTVKSKGVKVEFLFEQDGVKVYRFFDNGMHYFTTNLETISTIDDGDNSSTHEENIK